MSQSVAYVAEWACENNPTVGMSDKAMMAHYKANALAGDIRFYLSTQAASLTADEYHALAALALCHKMGWHGRLMAGHTKRGRVYVWLTAEPTDVLVVDKP